MHANSNIYIEVIDRKFLFICPPTCPTCNKKTKNSTRMLDTLVTMVTVPLVYC